MNLAIYLKNASSTGYVEKKLTYQRIVGTSPLVIYCKIKRKTKDYCKRATQDNKFGAPEEVEIQKWATNRPIAFS